MCGSGIGAGKRVVATPHEEADGRLRSWQSATALGGAAEGRPARMQSCGQRRGATTGVIQTSPLRSSTRSPRIKKSSRRASDRRHAGPSCYGPSSTRARRRECDRSERMCGRYVRDYCLCEHSRRYSRFVDRLGAHLRRAILTGLVVAAVAAMGVFAPSAAAASWVAEAAAVPAEPNGELAGVSCPTSRWCAAVGSFTDRAYRVRPLFEIFDGRRWHLARTTDSPDLTAPVGTAAGSFRGVSCASSVACVAVGTAGYNPTPSSFASLAARWNGRTWSAMQAPPPEIDEAVSCVSASMCVAVGAGAARWDGARWTGQRVAGPGRGGVTLTSVSCLSPNDCFAAGAADSSGNGVGVLERWDGTKWTVQRAAVGEDAGLDSSSATVSCASATSCEAIVEQVTYANSESPGRFTWFADVWNGHSWSTGRAPAASSISCVPGLCAAIGNGRAAVLDRHGWHVVRVRRSPQFQTGVSCASPRVCVGVGALPPPGPPQSGVLVTTPAGIRWNGSRWSRAAPAPGAGSQPSELHGVACASADACVAVGAVYSNTRTRPLAEIWGGRGWRLANPPAPSGGGVLESVSCVSPRDCVAVGYTLAGVPNRVGQGALVEAWNGSSWSPQLTPQLPGQVELHGVSCTSPSDCVAVGLQSPSPLTTGLIQPLIERRNRSGWTIDQQATGNSTCGTACTDFSQTLRAVGCASASECQAVGSTSTVQSTTTLAEAWNGAGWATAPTADPSPPPPDDWLTAISCATPTTCLAVGSGGPEGAFVQRWDGTGWSVRGSGPGPAANPNGISCTSSSRCEIVGFRQETKTFPARPQAWMWNGVSWAAQDPPGPASAALESVACPAASDCLAVGTTSTEPGPTTYPLSAPLIDRLR
jgi:hypothetical protein